MDNNKRLGYMKMKTFSLNHNTSRDKTLAASTSNRIASFQKIVASHKAVSERQRDLSG